MIAATFEPITLVQEMLHSPTANAMAGKMSRHVTHVGDYTFCFFARTSAGIRVHICMACHMTAGAVLTISLATSLELIRLLKHAAIAGCECWLRRGLTVRANVTRVVIVTRVVVVTRVLL